MVTISNEVCRTSDGRMERMSGGRSLQEVIHNSLKAGDLSFRDFVELVLYDPSFGYYRGARSPVGKEGDFVTGPTLSPAFSFALGGLVRQFLGLVGDGVSQIVDIGCGDGTLINTLSAEVPGPLYVGLERGDSLHDMPAADARLVISNELFDAQPFARLVRRGYSIHELTVIERDGALD